MQQYFEMKPEERDRLRSAAVHGDLGATLHLRSIHDLDPVPGDDWSFWLRLAAEQGHCPSIVQLSKQFHWGGKGRDAVTWAKRAVNAHCDADLKVSPDVLEWSRKESPETEGKR